MVDKRVGISELTEHGQYVGCCIVSCAPLVMVEVVGAEVVEVCGEDECV